MSNLLQTNGSRFAADVLTADLPALVYFTAAWCFPCELTSPQVEAFAASYNDKVIIAVIDTDECSSLAATYSVRSIPTLILFKDQAQVFRIDGPATKEQIEEGVLPWIS